MMEDENILTSLQTPNDDKVQQEKHVQFNEVTMVRSVPARKPLNTEIDENYQTACTLEAPDEMKPKIKIFEHTACNTDSLQCREMGTNTPPPPPSPPTSNTIERLRHLNRSEPIHHDFLTHCPLVMTAVISQDEAQLDNVIENTKKEYLRDLISKLRQAHKLASKKLYKMNAESAAAAAAAESASVKATEPLQSKINYLTSKIKEFKQEDGGEATTLNLANNKQQQKRTATSPQLTRLHAGTAAAATTLNTLPNKMAAATPRLARSNSFTLEVPSKALLDHMQRQCEERSVSPRNRNRKKPAAKTKVAQQKPNLKPIKPKVNFNTLPNSTAYIWSKPITPVRIKKSPYGDGKLTKQTKNKNSLGKSVQTSTLKVDQTFGGLKRTPSGTTFVVPRSNKTPTQILKTKPTTTDGGGGALIGEIESRHKRRLNLLLAQQRHREQRMQLAFDAQRRLLLEQFNNEMLQIDNCNFGQETRANTSTVPQPQSSTTTLQVEGISIKVHHSANNNFERLGASGAYLPSTLHKDMCTYAPKSPMEPLSQHVREAINRSSLQNTANENYLLSFNNSNQLPF